MVLKLIAVGLVLVSGVLGFVLITKSDQEYGMPDADVLCPILLALGVASLIAAWVVARVLKLRK